MAAGDTGAGALPELPRCWDGRRRWGGGRGADLSSGAGRFRFCFLSFSASTLVLTRCITVNSSCC